MTVALGTNIALPISSALSYRLAFDTLGKLANYGKLGSAEPADPDAVIEALFANNEQGAFYDPSDLSTMFQDSTGTMPVTADGQPVGLILDKSKGLVLGPELCGDPQFNGGWWDAGPGCAVTGGNGVATGAVDTSGFYRIGAIAIGVYYTVTFEVIEISEGGFKVFGLPGSPIENTLGVHSYTAKANGTLIGIFTYGASTTGKIDNVSVKQVAGNHGNQSTAAARPLLSGPPNEIDYDAVDDAVVVTFASSLGSTCTVARAVQGVGASILTNQTIGTTYTDNTDHCGLIIIDRALTTQETTDVTAWLTAKGATA